MIATRRLNVLGRLASGPACLAVLALMLCAASAARATDSLAPTVAGSQPKVAKIYGAGGLRALEPYQSGFLISAAGHVLTVWSYVLDSDYIAVTLDDGRRFPAELVGFDPRLEVAVLKIDATDLPHFDLQQSARDASVGTRVLAFSNLFGVATGDESASVQHGVIAARTRLDARRGTFETPYHGPVYVLDAMTNNPGAAGGALTTIDGQLLAMLGKELRNAQNNIWLNYAIPIGELAASVDDILAGKLRPGVDQAEVLAENPLDLQQLGVVLVPDVLERTPPYIEEVRNGSPAAAAGIEPDDLVVFVGETLVHSCKGLHEELLRIERGAPLRLVVMRNQELVELTLEAGRAGQPKPETDEAATK